MAARIGETGRRTAKRGELTPARMDSARTSLSDFWHSLMKVGHSRPTRRALIVQSPKGQSQEGGSSPSGDAGRLGMRLVACLEN